MFDNCLEKCLWVDSPQTISINKIDILKKAHYFGIRIPETIISNYKPEIIKFIQRGKTIIKPVSNVAQINLKKYGIFSMGTKLVTNL